MSELKNLKIDSLIKRGIYMKKLLLLFFISSANVSASAIDTAEEGVNELMAQTLIDVRFLDNAEVKNKDYQVIDDEVELFSLFEPFQSDSIVNLFFVDEINACSGEFAGFTGCSVNNSIAVTNIGQFQAELNTHELGHILSLDHIDEPNNIMRLLDFGNTLFNNDQIDAMLSSDFVQVDSNGFFVEVKPILVSAIPLPPSSIMFLSGIVTLLVRRIKK